MFGLALPGASDPGVNVPLTRLVSAGVWAAWSTTAFAAGPRDHGDRAVPLVVHAGLPIVDHAIGGERRRRHGRARRPERQLTAAQVSVIVTLDDEVDLLGHQQVEEVAADLAGVDEPEAVLVHPDDDPRDARRPGVVDRVDQPVIVGDSNSP